MSVTNPFVVQTGSMAPEAPESPEITLPLVQPGALNVHAAMPCPLKVRFRMEFENFLATRGTTSGTPIYCPQALEGKAPSLAERMQENCPEEELPDLIINPGMNMVFSQTLRPRFFEDGPYVGITAPGDLARLPESLQEATRTYNLGFLAFGSWQVVWDRTLADATTLPRTWDDLADPGFADQLSVHGCHGTIGANSLLLVLNDRLGLDAVTRFGANVSALSHFSKLIKGLGVQRERRPFNVLPNAASLQMPTNKDAAILEFRDGPLLTPMLAFVKKSKIEQAQEALAFFWGKEFRSVLTRGGYARADAMDWQQPWTCPQWSTLASHDHDTLSAEVEAAFQRGLGQTSAAH